MYWSFCASDLAAEQCKHNVLAGIDTGQVRAAYTTEESIFVYEAYSCRVTHSPTLG